MLYILTGGGSDGAASSHLWSSRRHGHCPDHLLGGRHLGILQRRRRKHIPSPPSLLLFVFVGLTILQHRPMRFSQRVSLGQQQKKPPILAKPPCKHTHSHKHVEPPPPQHHTYIIFGFFLMVFPVRPSPVHICPLHSSRKSFLPSVAPHTHTRTHLFLLKEQRERERERGERWMMGGWRVRKSHTHTHTKFKCTDLHVCKFMYFFTYVVSAVCVC